MLSVHRHYRSWNDKANELRAGRWVQDLLSLNQLTPRPLLCVLPGESKSSLVTDCMGFEFFGYV